MGIDGASANVAAALTLLQALRRGGLQQVVLCPGSRSAPLAVAAGLLEATGLRLLTAIDERSAAFFALGLGRAIGVPAAVITTSGTAVAQLLAATVEADLGTVPLLLLSADRPGRLKGCGANQTVPQERFLAVCCRWLGEGDSAGLGSMAPASLERLASRAMESACGDGIARPAGPVHLNLPFDEPLHADAAALERLEVALRSEVPLPSLLPSPLPIPPPAALPLQSPLPVPLPVPRLDPDRPGVVVAGPWRGSASEWAPHLEALRCWQRRSGWPVLADALSGLRGQPRLELIGAYDLILEAPPPGLHAPQVLRLGSLPASRRLQQWLQQQGRNQVLVSSGDARPLDPLGVVPAGCQWSAGLPRWLERVLPAASSLSASAASRAPAAAALAQRWQRAEQRAQALLTRELGAWEVDPPVPTAPEQGLGEPGLTEPGLARALAALLPEGLPLMLASSSPVRDWESFSGAAAAPRPTFGFRGASGIDGTLSIACGLAEALGQLLLVTGDLALLHDANGWLWQRQLRGRLTVLLIENGGGGIFEQLPIRTDPAAVLDFERLFAMPQAVDQLALAAVHGVPGRRIASPAALEPALRWGLEQPFAVLEVRSDRRTDAALRRRLRTMATREIAQP